VFTEAQKKQMTLKIRISDSFKMFPATESISHSSGYIVESRMHIRSPMALKITNGICEGGRLRVNREQNFANQSALALYA
jgi:hypothetical protein